MTTPAGEVAGVYRTSLKETERLRPQFTRSTGPPVLRVRGADRVAAGPAGAPDLLRVRWVETPVPGSPAGAAGGLRIGSVTADGALPEPVDGRVADLIVAEADESCDASGVCARVLAVLRAFLTDRRYDGSRLALVTRRGVAVEPSAPVNVAVAAAWGLARSAQSENPGRI